MTIDQPKLNSRTSSRKHMAIAFLVVTAIGVFYTLTFREGHDWGGDFALYLQHASNIAEGRPYAETPYVADYSIPISVGPPSYPPLLPLALAPTFALQGGLDWTLVKSVGVVLFCLSLFAVYAFVRRRLGHRRALLVVLLLALSPYFWGLKDQVLSDVPFTFFVYLTFILAEVAFQERDPNRRIVMTLAMGLSVYLAMATRALGVTLIPTLLIYEALRVRKIPIQSVAATVVVLALRFAQGLALGSTGGYLQSWRLDLFGLAHGIVGYPFELRALFWNGYVNGVAVAIMLIVMGLAIYGYVTSIKRGITVPEIFAVVYMAPVVIWPMRPNVRFMIPLAPLYFYYALIGLDRLRSRLSQRAAVRLSLALAMLIVGSYVSGYTRVERSHISNGIAHPDAVALFEHVRARADRDRLYLFFKPRVLSFFTGARSAVDYYPDESADLWSYYERIGATHLIKRQGNRQAGDLIAAHPGSFVLEFENPDFRVYRIERPATLSVRGQD
jgi:4-amino-4-deoxy-L-arabinose transferase-like glycosyltransferase